MRIKIIKGTWFRQFHKGTSLDEAHSGLIESPHIKENIRFVSNDTVELTGGCLRAGRETKNELVLDDRTVSREPTFEIIKHFLRGWWIKALKARVTIQRDGDTWEMQEKEELKLKDDDEILLGETALKIITL